MLHPEPPQDPPETAIEVSVVIPLFNAGELLRAQLDALARQDFRGQWEVVVADNGSSDHSPQIARQYDGRLHIRVVDASARRGPAHARNLGARVAAGEWIAYCDADDEVADDWLRQLYEARDPRALVAGLIDVTALNDPAVTFARGGPSLGRSLPDGPARFLPYAPSGNLLIRRDLLLELGGWDESLSHCEDVEFSWRAQLAGCRLAFAASAVVRYRFRSSARALFKQTMRYKAAEPALYKRFRRMGARTRGFAEVSHSLWWLLTRAPYVLLQRRRRFLWCALAGAFCGRVIGSFRERVVYL